MNAPSPTKKKRRASESYALICAALGAIGRPATTEDIARRACCTAVYVRVAMRVLQKQGRVRFAGFAPAAISTRPRHLWEAVS